MISINFISALVKEISIFLFINGDLLNLFIKKSRIKQNGEDMEDLDMPMLILFQISVQN